MIRNPSSAIARLRRVSRVAGAATITAFLAVGAILGVSTSATAADEKYIIGTDTTFAPFEFTNSDGELVGIDMDLLRAIDADQGF